MRVRKTLFLFPLTTAMVLTAGTALASNRKCTSPVTVAPGDTLASIAERCGSSLRSLLRFNPHLRNPDLLYAGTTLAVVATGRQAAEPAKAQVRTTGAWLGRYEVGRGDTLTRIARRFGLSAGDLRAANPGLSPRDLTVGKVIRLAPEPETAAKPVTVHGFIASDAGECVTLRDVDGNTYNLGGDAKGFRAGQWVVVQGTKGGASGCAGGTTALELVSIDSWS